MSKRRQSQVEQEEQGGPRKALFRPNVAETMDFSPIVRAASEKKSISLEYNVPVSSHWEDRVTIMSLGSGIFHSFQQAGWVMNGGFSGTQNADYSVMRFKVGNSQTREQGDIQIVLYDAPATEIRFEVYFNPLKVFLRETSYCRRCNKAFRV